jgi:hypothetical protein
VRLHGQAHHAQYKTVLHNVQVAEHRSRGSPRSMTQTYKLIVKSKVTSIQAYIRTRRLDQKEHKISSIVRQENIFVPALYVEV